MAAARSTDGAAAFLRSIGDAEPLSAGINPLNQEMEAVHGTLPTRARIQTQCKPTCVCCCARMWRCACERVQPPPAHLPLRGHMVVGLDWD